MNVTHVLLNIASTTLSTYQSYLDVLCCTQASTSTTMMPPHNLALKTALVRLCVLLYTQHG